VTTRMAEQKEEERNSSTVKRHWQICKAREKTQRASDRGPARERSHSTFRAREDGDDDDDGSYFHSLERFCLRVGGALGRSLDVLARRRAGSPRPCTSRMASSFPTTIPIPDIESSLASSLPVRRTRILLVLRHSKGATMQGWVDSSRLDGLTRETLSSKPGFPLILVLAKAPCRLAGRGRCVLN